MAINLNARKAYYGCTDYSFRCAGGDLQLSGTPYLMTIFSSKRFTVTLAHAFFSVAVTLISTNLLLAQTPITDPDGSPNSSVYDSREEAVQEPIANTETVQLREEEIRRIVAEYLEEKENQQKAEEKDKKKDNSMKASWNNGLEIASEDKNFKVHVGGRYQLDSSFFSAAQQVQQNINTPYHDGVDFRRARLRVDGTMYGNIDWAAEFDFVNALVIRNQGSPSISTPGYTEASVVAPTDLWWQIREVPFFDTIRIGNQKEQIGFEHIVSSRYLPFMERSFNQDTFYGGTYNGFNPGIQFFKPYGANENGVFSMGLFKPVNSVFGYGIGDGDYSVVGRATRLLWYECEGEYLMHVGISGKQATAVTNQGFNNRTQVFRTRDAVRAGLAGDWPVPAGITLYGDDMQWFNTEIASVYGPWTFQGEYLLSSLQDARSNLSQPGGENAVYHGGYLQLMYFLTGEHDEYNKKTGVFERLKPHENFTFSKGRCGSALTGLGAWQVGVRYNYLDLNDSGFNGGMLHNLTTGLNWFWNPNSKVQFNYIATYRDSSDTPNFPNGSGWINGFGTRIAIDF